MEGRLFLVVLCVLVSHGLTASVRSVKGSPPLGERVSQEECLSKGIRLLGNGSESNATLTRRSSNQDDKALTALFAGQMQFSLNFFKKVFAATQSDVQSKSASENLFFSPMSIYSALLLAYFGANNRTEDQLTEILGLQNMDKVGAVQAYKLVKFTRQLMRVAGLVKYDFDIANRFYFNEDENIRPCIKDIFNEDIEMLNFAFQPAESRTRINQWVEDITRNKIKDLVTSDTINANTRIALVNAAYFKGQWASQFKVANTRLTSFAINNKEEGVANMMFQKGRFRHAAVEELQANLLEMPFLGGDVSFFALLPEGNNGLEETVSRLTLDTLRNAMASTFPLTVDVGIPKFRLEQTLSLRNVLVKMGLTDMFDSLAADFSGFNGVPGLKFDAATHKAFIEVNEEGSEAAAATALVAFRMARPVNVVQFICDHPFMFFIYDNLSESILFMGVYRNPK
ncbi:serine protease inhibitor 88Ea-like [Daphnia pulicaria]|uniref:serine protease inhibitor 88Ea-like n=1 Tax=Daphnia pulicaria TaxID=35523 RepID=UPI001EEC1EE6|nr:serine protease inhibitor 88Ea-like [Daphnia pulicaria]XP_046648058.1 serine protease inhibitor 88Ea-like [Daphnia pulicaria]